MPSHLSLPKLWLSLPNLLDSEDHYDDSGKTDCDCNCTGGGGTSISPLNFERVHVHPLIQQLNTREIFLKKNEDLFLDHLAQYTFALSATGSHVVVLDEHANNLYSSFDSPTTLQALKQATQWPSEVVEQVVGLFLAEGLLYSPQIAQRAIVPDESTTLTAWLHLINGCNLSCRYCYLSFNGRQMDAATAQDAVDSIFRSAIAHGYSRVKLKYAGGEPTLNFKVLIAAQQHAATLSAQTNISLDSVMLTNGVRLNADHIDQLLSNKIRVMVSLDGLGDAHDVQRPLARLNTGSYGHVSRALDQLTERGIFPHISITVTNKNIYGLPRLVEYLLNEGLRFSLNFYREPTDSLRHAELSFTSAEMISGLKEVYRVIERRLPPYSLLSNLSDRADLEKPHSHTCGVGINYLVINHDGNVSKCQMEIEQSVTKINVEDPLAFIRADMIGIQNLTVEKKDLQKCVWRYRCTGGCSRLTFQRTGRYDAKSPMCEIYEAILPDVVRLEALRLIRYENPWDFETVAR